MIPNYMAEKYNFDINDNFFSAEYQNKDNIVPITDWFAFGFINMLKNCDNKNKFKIIKEYVIDNKDYSDNATEKFINIFYDIQKHYHVLSRFVNRVRWNIASSYECDCDLNMTPLNTISDNLKITLLENKNKYSFRLSDLINIINNSLSYSPDFFAKPLDVKNPYTNIAFSHSNLYNIYFKIRESTLLMPVLFHQFFTVDFDLEIFFYNNESLIREHMLNDYNKSTDTSTMAYEIFKMIRKNKTLFRPLNINPNFPKDKLVLTFRNMLKSYFDSLYSYCDSKRIFSKRNFRYQCKHFIRKYPRFGRKIYIVQNKESSGEYLTVSNQLDIKVDYITVENYKDFETKTLLENKHNATYGYDRSSHNVLDHSNNRVRSISDIENTDYYEMMDELNFSRQRLRPTYRHQASTADSSDNSTADTADGSGNSTADASDNSTADTADGSGNTIVTNLNVSENAIRSRMGGSGNGSTPIVLDYHLIDEMMNSMEQAINNVLDNNADSNNYHISDIQFIDASSQITNTYGTNAGINTDINTYNTNNNNTLNLINLFNDSGLTADINQNNDTRVWSVNNPIFDYNITFESAPLDNDSNTETTDNLGETGVSTNNSSINNTTGIGRYRRINTGIDSADENNYSDIDGGDNGDETTNLYSEEDEAEENAQLFNDNNSYNDMDLDSDID